MSRPTYTQQDFTDEEVQQLLDAYGGDAANWPSEIRDALSKTIYGSTRLGTAQQSALRLDQLLSKHRDLESARFQNEQTTKLAAKIMRELPPQRSAISTATAKAHALRLSLQHLTAWWPAPAIAAILVAFVVALLPSEQTLPNSAELAFEQWAWEDITAQNLVPENGAEIDEDFETLIGLQQDG